MEDFARWIELGSGNEGGSFDSAYGTERPSRFVWHTCQLSRCAKESARKTHDRIQRKHCCLNERSVPVSCFPPVQSEFQSGMSTVAATRQAPLDRVICSACRRNYTPNEFYLTACPHILCSTCLFPPPTLAPSTLPLDAQATCPACHEATSILKLEFDSPALNPNANEQIIALRHCFRPLGELVEELGMAAEFQTAGLLEQVDYLTEKVARQRNVLDKVQVELRAHKQLKLCVFAHFQGKRGFIVRSLFFRKYEETRAENDQLRLQLQERNNMVSQLQQGSYHPFAQESRKRKPLGSPPSSVLPPSPSSY